MPRKAFIADLSQAIAGTDVLPNISNVRKGGDDGEFVFAVHLGQEGSTIELTANISDVSEYPSSHSCFFIAPDNAPASVAAKLGDTFEQTFGKTVQQLLQLVSRTVQPKVDRDNDVEMVDSQADSDYDEQEFDSQSDDEETEDYFPDDMLSPELPGHTSHTSAQPTFQSTSPFRARIRSDMRMAKAAGFKVGYLGDLLGGGGAYVTVSIRVAKLGISTEAMQAWQILPTEYLALILYYPLGYQSLDDLMRLDGDAGRRYLGIRVGLSATYKPTLQEAVHAFTKLAKEEAKDQGNLNVASEPSSLNLGFRNAFISGPLNEFFNDRLLKIVTFRYSGMCWGGAEEFLADHMASTTRHSDLLDEKYLGEEVSSGTFPDVVTADHIRDASIATQHTFPLIAMQALLRHFVRCTEFCLVCFRRLPDDLEAIKPYVCDNPLCLYQYMSLGFGPSIEHEILAQPNVVDLLISFCYTSARLGGLNSFPTGLSLMVPPSINDFSPYTGKALGAGLSVQADGQLTVKYDHGSRQFVFEAGSTCPFRIGDWVMVRFQGKGNLLHARVTDTTYFPIVTISDFIQAPAEHASNPAGTNAYYQKAHSPPPAQNAEVQIPPGQQFVTVNTYAKNFDELSDAEKRTAICTLLDIVPRVADMKAYLSHKANVSLASWLDRIPPSGISLLRWIIASSRACILELEGQNGDSRKRDERLYGMDGWLQFRFAMGAPDKERRFINEVRATTQRKSLQHPTIYAWHGSPIKNWHSIIREGLHYKQVSHGRAFGDGVYHSPHVQTSMGYSGHHGGYPSGIGGASNGVWPQSDLKINCALALNEIVNAPDEFTSKNPHLVVQNVDWIQTRYLFVKVNTPHKNIAVARPTEEQPQDPSMTPTGEGGNIVIPMKSSAKKRRSTMATIKNSISKRLKGSGKKNDPISFDDEDDEGDFDDAASVKTDTEDRNILEDEEPQKIEPIQTKSKKPEKPMTDFVPGHLDYSTLPTLGEPSWASVSATKRLQQDFKNLLKVQAKEPLHELGWYIDPELINNMYQWIMELHSFESHLPLAKDMKSRGLKSIVLELRFGKDFPMSPPFVRVIRPRFLSFQAGGGGHVTAGGALCMELLTNNGWSAVSSIESVLLQVRLAMSSTDPRPAKLENGPPRDYSVGEAVDAYIRSCQMHGWQVPDGFREMAYGGQRSGPQAAGGASYY